MIKITASLFTMLLAFNLAAQPPAPEDPEPEPRSQSDQRNDAESELEAFKKAKHPPPQSGGVITTGQPGDQPPQPEDAGFKKGQQDPGEPE